jgi:hypothetical protein
MPSLNLTYSTTFDRGSWKCRTRRVTTPGKLCRLTRSKNYLLTLLRKDHDSGSVWILSLGAYIIPQELGKGFFYLPAKQRGEVKML